MVVLPNCQKPAVEHSIEKPISLNFVNLSIIPCPRVGFLDALRYSLLTCIYITVLDVFFFFLNFLLFRNIWKNVFLKD